ncbi:MAG: divalent-cation tolerance protein CutA [Candidatus Omnitrophota bacterium]
MSACILVLTTAPSEKSARIISDQILKARLAACVSIVPRIGSRYLWKGKRVGARESLLLIKAPQKNYAKLQRLIVKVHPYEVPEILAIPALKGYAPYLRWLSQETR